MLIASGLVCIQVPAQSWKAVFQTMSDYGLGIIAVLAALLCLHFTILLIVQVAVLSLWFVSAAILPDMLREVEISSFRQAANIFKDLGEDVMYSDTLMALGIFQFKNGQFLAGATTYQTAVENRGAWRAKNVAPEVPVWLLSLL